MECEKMKCENCKSVFTYIDDELDYAWCKTCGYYEIVDYKALPENKS